MPPPTTATSSECVMKEWSQLWVVGPLRRHVCAEATRSFSYYSPRSAFESISSLAASPHVTLGHTRRESMPMTIRSLKCLDDVDVTDRKVLVRVDHNVPLTDDGRIRDDERIVRSLGTLRELISRGRCALSSYRT